MSEVVFARTGWIPRVVRDGDGLRLELGAGADALHNPRTFSFPISEKHLAVLRSDLARHLLLWCAVLPLCDAAGTERPLDEDAAIALLDPLLLGEPATVDAWFRETGANTTMLVAHGADIDLLEAGRVLDSLHAATAETDEERIRTYVADRDRKRRGVQLGPLDTAVLKYVGHYEHRSALSGRHPDAVAPSQLPDVLRVIATAEQASVGMRITEDPRRGYRALDKHQWHQVAAAVDAAVRAAHPELVDDAVEAVSFLMCHETADRSRGIPLDDDLVGDAADAGSGAKTTLLFSDENGAETTWHHEQGSRSASAAFWEFVAERARSGSRMGVLTDEAEEEQLELHFYADSAARVMSVGDGDAPEPSYQVDYRMVDTLEDYRLLVGAFVRGGCEALAQHGPWTADVDEFERARERRAADGRQ